MLARILDTQQSAVDILQGQQQVGLPLFPLVSSSMFSLPQEGTTRFSYKSSNVADGGGGGGRGAICAQVQHFGT